ncbi:hypothetical protein [Vannielia litorea]|uniref:hypothetical protein n=1 Tax=Vannielia litorea TaxID=1217970 RepID=UPI001BCFD86F|nr:hypothetical protein [Vannielia litorea]MBS8227907.1 hypothetical protein [Vannielia litorea]
MSVSPYDQLPEIPTINGLFVKAERDAVAARFRGAFAVTAEDENEVYEVSGDDARIDLHFGPEMNRFKSAPRDLVDITERTFEISGFARVSKVRCNPLWTFVEQAVPLEGEQYIFDEWLGVPSIAVWSLDGIWDAYGALHYGDVEEAPAIREGFSYHEEGANTRWVELISNAHDGTSFTRRGQPMWFEDPSHYEAKKTRDRMSRTILFEILGKLGVDAVSVFGRRELDDPLFYSTRIRGRSCAGFQDERRRLDDILS